MTTESSRRLWSVFFFQAEDGIRDLTVTGVQTCALPISPRVLLCNSNLVGHWNNWDRFHELDRAGLMMYGQMTAGSWIYIGTQGILQGKIGRASCRERV